MSKRYTVRNNQTGQDVTFDWHDDVNPPTEADMEEVFAQASRQAPAPVDSPYGEVAPDFFGAAKEVGGWVKENPGTAGAMAAGIAVAPFTGGMSVPAMMALEGGAAAAGSALGHGAKQALTGEGHPEGPFGVARDSLLEGVLAGGTAGVGPALKAVGKGLYHTALRPTLTLNHTPDEIAQLVQTGLDEGINVSRKGYQDAGKLISGLGADVRKLIDSLNATPDTDRAFAQIDALRQKYLRRGVPPEKIAALDKIEEHYRSLYSGSMPGGAMQELKSGIWTETGPSFSRELNTGTTEGMRAFASGLRETLEEEGRRRGVTSIGELNARQGRLIDLQEQVERSAAHYPLAGARQGVEMMVGGAPGLLMRAIATSAPALSSIGRGLNFAGNILDPRAIRPAVSHPSAITDESRLLGPAPIPLGPAPDTSYVRGVPAPASPRPIKGYLPSAEVRRSTPDFAVDGGHVIPQGAIPDTSGRIPAVLPENAGKSIDGLDIPVVGNEPYAPNGLDALDIPVTQEMYTPEELWIKKQLIEMKPSLAHLPFDQWKILFRKVASNDTYRNVGNQPNVRITKEKVNALYDAYLKGSAQ